MPKCMPIVQNVTQPAIMLIKLNHTHLQANAAGNDCSQQSCIANLQRAGMRLEQLKQLSIKNHTILDNFCPSFAIDTLRQRQKHCRIDHHQPGLVIGANERSEEHTSELQSP